MQSDEESEGKKGEERETEQGTGRRVGGNRCKGL